MAITVENGVNLLTAELAGRTVAQVREMLRQPLNIDPTAHPAVNGQLVSEDYVLGDNHHLDFGRAGGRKGAVAARRNGLKLVIWPKDDLPPHFHVQYQGKDASFRITDCERLSAGLEPYETTIKKLWREERVRLSDEWNRLRPRNPHR